MKKLDYSRLNGTQFIGVVSLGSGSEIVMVVDWLKSFEIFLEKIWLPIEHLNFKSTLTFDEPEGILSWENVFDSPYEIFKFLYSYPTKATSMTLKVIASLLTIVNETPSSSLTSEQEKTSGINSNRRISCFI